jgi:diguanylate cyclase (GGDEF)-like protein
MEVKYYVRVLQRGWWIILLTMIIAVNAALIVSYLIDPLFQTESRFVVSPNAALYDDTWDVVSSLDTLDRRSIINTYKEVLASSSTDITNPVFTGMEIEDIEDYEILVTVVPDSNIVQLTVTGPSADRVVEISEGISEDAIEFINELYPVYTFSVLDAPDRPTEPYSPRPVQNAGLALIAGLIVGVGLAFLRDQLESTLESVRMRSIVDNVSTAYTKDYIERRLNEEISLKPEETLSLGIINFRGFEEVIDVIPQSFANRAIQQLTQTLKEELRGRDLVGRWEKTQLAVMLPTTSGLAAENTFKRLQKILETPIQFAEGADLEIQPDPCIGIVTNTNSPNLDSLIDKAEDAVGKATAIQGDTIITVH